MFLAVVIFLAIVAVAMAVVFLKWATIVVAGICVGLLLVWFGLMAWDVAGAILGDRHR